MNLTRLLATIIGLLIGPLCLAADTERKTEANVVAELSFTSQRPHSDPFNEITLDALVTDPAGTVRKVPAFWDGGARWKVRYASPVVGKHRWRTVCNDAAD